MTEPYAPRPHYIKGETLIGKRLLFAAAVLLVAAVSAPYPASAETVTVNTDGQGKSPQQAVAAALVSAVEQVSGLRIEGSSTLHQELSQMGYSACLGCSLAKSGCHASG